MSASNIPYILPSDVICSRQSLLGMITKYSSVKLNYLFAAYNLQRPSEPSVHFMPRSGP